MRKKIWLIFCILIIWVRTYSTTIYFSTTGNDATGSGAISKPFASLGKATSVSVPGDIVYGFAGVYHQNTQVIIPLGVSLQGEGNGASGTHIFITYNIPVLGPNAFYQGSINMNSTVEGTNGNQTVNDIWFDGNNFTSFQGISVRCRSNVIFNRCKFTNFQVCAVNLNGKFGRNTGTPPGVFSTGNKILNSTFIDCNDRTIQKVDSVSCGSITYEGQSHLLFKYDTLINTGKASGHNGDLFGAVQGNNKWVTWLNNILTKPADDGSGFNFGVESWYDMGHSEYAFNTYTGGGNAIDIGYGGSNKDTSAYSWYIHDNIFSNPSLLTSNNIVQPVLSIAIQFESTTNTPLAPINNTIGDVIIQNNYCKNIGTFVQIAMNNFAGDFFKHAQIDHNVLENMGYANNTYAGIFQFTINLGTLVDSIFITNNTVLSNIGAGCSKGVVILQPNVGVMSHIYFVNNIAINVVSGYAYFVFRGNTACDNIFLQNNITFNNAFTNNAFTFGGTPAQTNLTNTNNVKLNPQFISSADFHLQSTSPGVNGGLSPPAVYIGAYPPGTIVPTITWANPAAITYGTPLSSTQLNATSGGVPGTFAYSPAIGTVLDAGTQTLTVIFTPTDQATYSVVSKSVTIVVNKATAILSFSNLTQTYTGSQLSPTVTTIPSGLSVISTTYNGIATVPINAGAYTVVSGLNNPNYSATSITATFTISKAVANINVSNLSQTYDGTQKPITASTSPIGLNTLSITYNGSGTPPTNAGTYSVVVTLTNANYQASPVNTTLVIAKATPTVSWSNPAGITYPTALSGTQLNASASVAGTLTYTPPSGTVLNAGSHIISVDFAPTDATNYNSVNNTTVVIFVSKASATINVSDLNQFFDGNPKPVTVSTTPAGLAVLTTTYNASTTAPSAVGSYSVHVILTNSNYTASPFDGTLVISNSSANIFITNLNQTYTGSPLPVTVTTNPSGLAHTDTYNGSATVPTNAGSYTVIATLNSPFTGADTQTLVIAKATPVINWNDPASIPFGTALSSTQLNATSTVAGTFVYTPTTGTVLNVGTQSLSVALTPTDATNYNSASKIVSITVTGTTATLSLSNLVQTYNGSPRSVIVTTNPAGLGGVNITYNGSSTPPTNAGRYGVLVTLINDNYTATPLSDTLVISQAVPVLSWALPAAIQFGTALSSTQLNATANIPGSFVYNPPSGTLLNAGTSLLTATFTPTSSNYSTAIISVPLSIYGTPFLNFFIIHGNTNYLNLPGQIPDLKP